MDNAILSYSGGLDSTALFLSLLLKEANVHAITFDYGQKHKIEIKKAQVNVEYFKKRGFQNKIVHHIIDLSDIMSLFHSSLISEDLKMPEGYYKQSNMKSTVVPNRNAIFSSLIYGYALSRAKEKNTKYSITLAVHKGDHTIYPDCRIEFYDLLYDAFKAGNWDSHLVDIYLPFIKMDKAQVLKTAYDNSQTLGFDFDTIMSNTNTSYEPNLDGSSNGKTGADIERILAFNQLNLIDPITYAGGWDKALAYALNSKKEYEKS